MNNHPERIYLQDCGEVYWGNWYRDPDGNYTIAYIPADTVPQMSDDVRERIRKICGDMTFDAMDYAESNDVDPFYIGIYVDLILEAIGGTE